MSNTTQNSIHYKSNFIKIVEVLVLHEYYMNKNCFTIDFILNQENRIKIRIGIVGFPIKTHQNNQYFIANGLVRSKGAV